ncbi:MAG: hypothetical protein ABGY09_01875, partial [Euryarchaeota archaeon]
MVVGPVVRRVAAARWWWVTLLAALLGAGPVLVNPLFPRDAPAHAFALEYAWLVLEGRAPADVCPYWYLGFAYPSSQCLLPYLLESPLIRLLSPPRAFAVGLVLAAWVFCLGVYALARRLGLREWVPRLCLLAAVGMSLEWAWFGDLPLTMSLGFGLLALAFSGHLILTPVFLALSLYSHPLGGVFSCLVTALWGLARRSREDVLSVPLAVLLAAPQYAYLLYHLGWITPELRLPPSVWWVLLPSPYSPGVFLTLLGLLGIAWSAWERPGWRTAAFTSLVLALAIGILTWLLGRWNVPIHLPVNQLACASVPLLAVSSGFALWRGGRWVRLLYRLSVLPVTVPWIVLLLTPVPVVPGSGSAWSWVTTHWSGDPLFRVEVGPFLRAWPDPYWAAWNCVVTGPRLTGELPQADPYFRALTERAEWELFWWEDPGFVRVVGWLGNVEYLVTAL